MTLLRDVLDYIEHTGETGILISLDQEKAFDRVDHSFLFSLLARFGFGPDFIKWIKMFYTDASMRIILNDWLTDKIFLCQGVRQGDPLSPLLYVLCVEVLACSIRKSNEIRGFLLPGARGSHFKVRQYADDTTSFLKDYRLLVNLFSIVSLYERGSGAKLNRGKTKAMWLGAWKTRTSQPLGLKWVTKMKILGVFFGTEPVEEANWQHKINKLEKALNLWKSRALSLVGKSLIVNVLGFSKFLYLAKVLVIPQWVLVRVNQLVWPFIWGSRIETVSRDSLFCPVASGGLNIINLDLKCEALRVSSLVSTFDSECDSSFYLCKYFVGSRLARMKPEWSFLRDISPPSTIVMTPFYEHCLKTLDRVDYR